MFDNKVLQNQISFWSLVQYIGRGQTPEFEDDPGELLQSEQSREIKLDQCCSTVS